MRVIMRYNTTPTTPCGTINYGQVEDYTVNIVSTARMEDETASNDAVSFKLFPNPVQGDLLNITDVDVDSTFKVFNMMGQEVGKGKIENESIYVGSLSAGTYLIEVSNAKGSTSKRFIKQ